MTLNKKAAPPLWAVTQEETASIHPDKDEVNLNPKDNVSMVKNQLEFHAGNSVASHQSRILVHLQTVGPLTTLKARHILDFMHPGKSQSTDAPRPVNLRALKVGSKQWHKEKERLRKEAEQKLESVKAHHPIQYSLWMEGLEDWALLIPEPSGIAIGCLRVDDALKCWQNFQEAQNA